jgi:hypothetical protein
MRHIANQLEELVNEYAPLIKAISPDNMNHKPAPNKWSKKEIIGHLVDSALTNSRRFIVAQYEEAPLIVYAQDEWVIASAYQDYNSDDLIQLWILLNKHIYKILTKMPEHLWSRTCRTQELHTLEWLAEDYIQHLKHHMHVVLDREPYTY